MENNIIINGVEEKAPERTNPASLASILKNVFIQEREWMNRLQTIYE